MVAYFSYSGNTEKVAKQIADYTGGTLAEIERATPYTIVTMDKIFAGVSFSFHVLWELYVSCPSCRLW